ncbi:hypothetical protein GCM10027193_00840 [Arenimonas aestuarii]
MIFTGHEHEGVVGLIDDTESERSAFVEGWVLQHDSQDLSETGFNILEIDVQKKEFNCTAYRYSKGAYRPSPSGSWEEFHELPAIGQSSLSLRVEFLKKIRDPGALFLAHGGEPTLDDLYVYPDLKVMGSPRARRKFLDARSLREPDQTRGGVIVEGDDRSGCTSLLHQLYISYHSIGFAPVLIRGADIKHASNREIDSVLKRAIKAQYEDESVESVLQSPKAKKIILIDDFDECPLDDSTSRAAIICALRSRSDHSVITVGKLFEVKEMVERGSENELASMTHYELQLFGFKKRGELIERWFTHNSVNAGQGEGQFIAKCDVAEKLINTAMDKSIIPSSPLYLLALLQSVDAGNSAELKESALGHYYHFLLTQAFAAAGVASNKFTEMFDYVAHLAWRFHESGRSELTHGELKEFNACFSEEWTPVEFSPRLETLLSAKVLHRVGDSYAFRYPYMYYYLKGMRLAKLLGEESSRAYVEHCCSHLYVRDYANTVLFLAHHTDDDWLLAKISAALVGLFRDVQEVQFGDDTLPILQLISNAPKLTFGRADPRAARAERNERRDDNEHDSDDGLLDAEAASDNLPLAAKLAMLFKTIDILGQVLKNQYSSIKRSRKRELLKELFNGPLRALASFYRFYEEGPDKFSEQITKLLEARGGADSSEAAARRVVANVVLGVTCGILHRGSRSANSEDLLEDVQLVVRENGSAGFQLMELAVLLDSAKDLPRVQISKLLLEGGGNILIEMIVSLLVMNRLYMFKTSKSDMNWVSNNLNIAIEIQHQIAYQNSGRQIG